MKCFGSALKVYRCKIVLLDETELIQEIKDSQKGQDILDIVFKHLDLLETVYFGLRYIDSKGFSCWLDPNKNAIKQVKDVEPITLYFGVKFYAPDPCKLREECTRYQFFLQIKQDIQQSRLPVTNELAAQLLAYIIQSELGDYDPKIHQLGYVSEFCWIENQSLDFENKVCDLHKKLIGQIPAAVEMQFLDRVKWIDLYGCELHSVVAEDRHEYFLGLGPHGIIVLKNKLKIAYYYWPRIEKIWQKGKFFMIKVTDKNNQDKTYGFEMPDRIATYRIYKSCKNHKEFFQLSQNVSQTKIGYRQLNDGSNKIPMRVINQDFDRPNPSLVRISSRRFKRIGNPDGSEIPNDMIKSEKSNLLNECNSSAAISRFNSIPSLPKADYGAPNNRKSESGLFSKSASASPLSVRSAFVARYDYGRLNYVSPMKRNASSSSLRRYRSSKSDNESDVSSKFSRNSSKCHGGSGREKKCSGYDSNHMPRSKRKLGIEPQMVEWNDMMDRRHNNLKLSSMPSAKQCSSAIVTNTNKLINSGNDTDSDIIPNRSRYNNSNKVKNVYKSLPTEIQKYIVPEPIDTAGFTESEKKNIYFTKIQSDSKIPPQHNDYNIKINNRYRINNNDINYQHHPYPSVDLYCDKSFMIGDNSLNNCSRYYFEQKHLNHLIQQSNNSSSPRVTFLPSHSTAYYSNSDNYTRNLNNFKHDQGGMTIIGSTNTNKNNEMSTEL